MSSAPTAISKPCFPLVHRIKFPCLAAQGFPIVPRFNGPERLLKGVMDLSRFVLMISPSPWKLDSHCACDLQPPPQKRSKVAHKVLEIDFDASNFYT